MGIVGREMLTKASREGFGRTVWEGLETSSLPELSLCVCYNLYDIYYNPPLRREETAKGVSFEEVISRRDTLKPEAAFFAITRATEENFHRGH